MSSKKCPVCGSTAFYIKDPDDEYEIYEFELRNGEISVDETDAAGDMPAIEDRTETYCNKCAWHDRFSALKSQ